MKSPIPLIIALGLGGILMSLGSKKKSNPVEDEEAPTTLDYEDPELRSALSDADDSEDQEESDEEEEDA